MSERLELSADDFTIFGIPQRQRLDQEMLAQRWRALLSKVHPDRHAAQGPAAQRLAMQWSMRINEAYRRLKDPVSRAAYLCGLRGLDVQADSNTRMSVDFLAQQMQWREQLQACTSPADVAPLLGEVQAHSRDLQERLVALLDGDQGAGPDLPAAAQQVRALMFVQRFIEDIGRRSEGLQQGPVAA